MHNKSKAYRLLKDKLKTGLSLKDNKLIAELRQLPSSPCDVADALALSPRVHCNASLSIDENAVFILPEEYDSVVRS